MSQDWLFLLIPFFSAFIGWGTNVLAVQMMFSPVEFIGIRPLGWQGIIPSHAVDLARRSTELVTSKLIDLKALFDGFDAESFSGNLGTAIDELTDQIVKETAEKYAAAMWEAAAPAMKDQVRAMVRKEVVDVTIRILADMGDNIEQIIDITQTVVDVAEADKGMVGDMFQVVGDQEFKFIRRSGAYFGFAFGIMQMGAWLVYPAWWVLPLFGFFVGYATNWLALKMIFEPQEPKKIGPITVQGLFHKRQQQVAEKYAKMVADDILNPKNLVARMVKGSTGEVLFGIVDKHVGELVERYKNHPMAGAMVPADKWPEIERELRSRIRVELPKDGGFLYTFTSKAIDVFGTLFSKMSDLDSSSFEGTLRPAFQKDEWKLIIAGAALGLAAGILQVVYLFGEQLA